MMISNPKMPYIIEFCLIYEDFNKINWSKVKEAYGIEKTEEIQKLNKSFFGS